MLTRLADCQKQLTQYSALFRVRITNQSQNELPIEVAAMYGIDVGSVSTAGLPDSNRRRMQDAQAIHSGISHMDLKSKLRSMAGPREAMRRRVTYEDAYPRSSAAETILGKLLSHSRSLREFELGRGRSGVGEQLLALGSDGGPVPVDGEYSRRRTISLLSLRKGTNGETLPKRKKNSGRRGSKRRGMFVSAPDMSAERGEGHLSSFSELI